MTQINRIVERGKTRAVFRLTTHPTRLELLEPGKTGDETVTITSPSTRHRLHLPALYVIPHIHSDRYIFDFRPVSASGKRYPYGDYFAITSKKLTEIFTFIGPGDVSPWLIQEAMKIRDIPDIPLSRSSSTPTPRSTP